MLTNAGHMEYTIGIRRKPVLAFIRDHDWGRFVSFEYRGVLYNVSNDRTPGAGCTDDNQRF